MSYLILFKLDGKSNAVRLKVNRYLRKIKAKMFQRAVWESANLKEPKTLERRIRSWGGKAVILKKAVVK